MSIEIKERPLVTFVIFAFNQQNFVREAVEAALAQTYSPLEIILSDDCSDDGTFEIMRQMASAYQGSHQLVLNRNPVNLGIGGHVNKIMGLAQGQLIVGAAGDDISNPTRVGVIYERWTRCPQAQYIHSAWYDFDDGVSRSPEALRLKNRSPGPDSQDVRVMIARGGADITGCSSAWQRGLFDAFGPIPADIFQEDRVIPFRALLLGEIAYIDTPLVYHRLSVDSVWGRVRDDRSLSIAEATRRRLVRYQQQMAIFQSWRIDTHRAMGLGIIKQDQAESVLDLIGRAERSRKLGETANSGSYAERLVAAIMIVLKHDPFLDYSWKRKCLTLALAICPPLKRLLPKRVRFA